MGIDLDSYYRGLASERLQSLGDDLLRMSQEAAEAEADSAAWRLASLSTELLDLGIEVKEGR